MVLDNLIPAVNVDYSISEENQDDVHSINCKQFRKKESSEAAIYEYGSKSNFFGSTLNQIGIQ